LAHNLMKVLSSDVRVEILKILDEKGASRLKELMRAKRMWPHMWTHHLKFLMKYGYVTKLGSHYQITEKGKLALNVFQVVLDTVNQCGEMLVES